MLSFPAGPHPPQLPQALRLPRVALLFLTRGDLYHHEAWAAWFRAGKPGAAGMEGGGKATARPARLAVLRHAERPTS